MTSYFLIVVDSATAAYTLKVQEVVNVTQMLTSPTWLANEQRGPKKRKCGELRKAVPQNQATASKGRGGRAAPPGDQEGAPPNRGAPMFLGAPQENHNFCLKTVPSGALFL